MVKYAINSQKQQLKWIYNAIPTGPDAVALGLIAWVFTLTVSDRFMGAAEVASGAMHVGGAGCKWPI